MSIKIKRLLHQDSECFTIELCYEKQIFTASIKGISLKVLNNYVANGEDLIVEMEYDKLLSARKLSGYRDEKSIIMAKSNHYLLRARVCQLVPINSDILIDLYFHSADFLTILQSECKGVSFELDQGVEIELTGLTFVI